MTPLLTGPWCGWVVPGTVNASSAALRAVLAALGVTEVPPGEPREGAGVVLLDADCPFTDASAVAAVVAAAATSGRCAVGVRPVTDTVKRLKDGFLGETVDREALVAVAAPLVVPAGVVAEVGAGPLPVQVARLRASYAVELVEVGARGRRVADTSDLAVLRATGAPRPEPRPRGR